ncbi:undecaprenyl-diphosphate phosphatase [Candidatus Micrarchaeota archaeon]|nr:undecaprenyl-diphosphate phosphatase [Candidatus Micrarchaeota archaeon]
MDAFQAVLLGILQGVTEWLPVSSSGHLALAQIFFGIEVPVAFDVALHLGTLFAVLIYFRSDLVQLLRGLLSFNPNHPDFRTLLFLVVAMIPTAIIGFAFRDFFEDMFFHIQFVGAALLITGFLLFAASRIPAGKKEVGWKSALLIGAAQGLSVAPGISRSGATISAGMLYGIPAEKAARFSFLLSIPAIIGASFFQLQEAEFAAVPLAVSLSGILSAAVVGYLSIGFLLKILREAKLVYFAYYCWAIGLLAILSAFIM